MDTAGSDQDTGQQANLGLDPDLPHHYGLYLVTIELGLSMAVFSKSDPDPDCVFLP